MTFFTRCLLLLPAGGLSAAAYAVDATAPASVGSLFQVFFGLIVVLALMAGAAWLIRRLGVSKIVSVSAVKIVGGVSVGSRERILVVEVADQWIVVGVAPGRVNALSTMSRQEIATESLAVPGANNFSAWLKQTIEKRNAQ
ncbi:flagellar biosynthetic protein FliO [Herbaspirillum sp. GCM10030257]|uniref:flagellar biosynthetic protein FliO n=1 Tax=Herbaspirillum sp. GCM10030257 TaxID=3273393 RepID=UPI00362230BE